MVMMTMRRMMTISVVNMMEMEIDKNRNKTEKKKKGNPVYVIRGYTGSSGMRSLDFEITARKAGVREGKRNREKEEEVNK